MMKISLQKIGFSLILIWVLSLIGYNIPIILASTDVNIVNGSISTNILENPSNPLTVDGKIEVINTWDQPIPITISGVKPSSSFNKDELFMNKYEADIWLISFLVWAVALAQFLITLILLVRVVVLWLLLILSPFLLVLALVTFSKSLFKTWLWVYLRWILIGPLLIMGLGIMVNIWTISGVPIQSLAEQQNLLTKDVTNLTLAAPYHFSNASNLVTNHEVMKLLVAIIMLYAVIFLPFWLTKKSTFAFLSEKSVAKFKTLQETAGTSSIYSDVSKDSKQEQKISVAEDLKNKIDNLKLNKVLDHVTSFVWGSAVKSDFNRKEKNLVGAEIQSKSPLDSPKFTELVLKLDTATLIKIANLTPLMNPKRNQALAEMANPEMVLSEIRKNNLKKLVYEIGIRAERGDSVAKNILLDVKKAESMEHLHSIEWFESQRKEEHISNVNFNQQESIIQSESPINNLTENIQQTPTTIWLQNVWEKNTVNQDQPKTKIPNWEPKNPKEPEVIPAEEKLDWIKVD